VAAQQRAGGILAQDGAPSEATFGGKSMDEDETTDNSKIDYYAVAHRVTEKITQQPSLLVGGTLKEVGNELIQRLSPILTLDFPVPIERLAMDGQLVQQQT
jgi:hypothetical protein